MTSPLCGIERQCNVHAARERENHEGQPRSMRKRIGSLLILSAGILLLLLGMAGLVLPIIPGFALILLGLWMIRKVHHSPLLERMLEYVKRKKDSLSKRYSERRTIEL